MRTRETSGDERNEEAEGPQSGVQGEGGSGSPARGQDDQRDRSGIWRTPGAGRAVEEGDPGTGQDAV